MRISKDHGLNPSINVCFFCGQDKELLMFGKLKGDVKAPQRVMANYTPCKACAEKFAKGRLVIEVVQTDTGGLPIVKGAWPTGRWCVLDRGTAAKLFKDLNNRPVLLEQPLYEALIERKH